MKRNQYVQPKARTYIINLKTTFMDESLVFGSGEIGTGDDPLPGEAHIWGLKDYEDDIWSDD